ncbi:hypothetical protein JQX13_32055 [Archangium violaceum]|uniref:hypothetical protein n=1 Tax=Archangium violaceum TaxID=83451 RepID=UPI00193C459F|nr:hypothetical protein [Archangium violaceum]QRK04838.1 hypothetical protein JQX13_32055 [Archangium violaceum]
MLTDELWEYLRPLKTNNHGGSSRASKSKMLGVLFGQDTHGATVWLYALSGFWPATAGWCDPIGLGSNDKVRRTIPSFTGSPASYIKAQVPFNINAMEDAWGKLGRCAAPALLAEAMNRRLVKPEALEGIPQGIHLFAVPLGDSDEDVFLLDGDDPAVVRHDGVPFPRRSNGRIPWSVAGRSPSSSGSSPTGSPTRTPTWPGAARSCSSPSRRRGSSSRSASLERTSPRGAWSSAPSRGSWTSSCIAEIPATSGPV